VRLGCVSLWILFRWIWQWLWVACYTVLCVNVSQLDINACYMVCSFCPLHRHEVRASVFVSGVFYDCTCRPYFLYCCDWSRLEHVSIRMVFKSILNLMYCFFACLVMFRTGEFCSETARNEWIKHIAVSWTFFFCSNSGFTTVVISVETSAEILICCILCIILFTQQSGREADHSPPSSAEVKNAWSYTSTPVRLHDVVLS
jgi:hypothetical protein